MDELKSEFLFEMKIDVNAPLDIGRTEQGERRFVVISSGRFEGPRLSGEVLPGGADSIFMTPDGIALLDVRAVLKTDDGAMIYIQYVGRRHGPADVMTRLAAGDAVDPASYYFRTALTFETGDARYSWLNGMIAIAKGSRPPAGPIYRVFQIL